MKIIISPAKKMINATDDFEYKSLPIYDDLASNLFKKMQSLKTQELKECLKISATLAIQVKEMYQKTLESHRTPALFTFSGIQYKYMAPSLFTRDELDYVESHLIIVSAMYGYLRPFDGINLYRLDFESKLDLDLYEYHQDCVNDFKDELIINLSSKEYYHLFDKLKDHMINIWFLVNDNGVLKNKGTYAKMARGRMCRYLAENKIEEPHLIKNFNELGYLFNESLSDDYNYYFVK